MYFTGFADEASVNIEGQIRATQLLGWKFIESRNINGVNIHDIDDAQFEHCRAALDAAGIGINCFGSAIANWACDPMLDADFEKTKQQLQRAITRMAKLNCTLLRGMSFKAQWHRPAFDPEVEAQVFKKVRILLNMCEEAGIYYLHENCNNYGGMSWKHTLKLLDKIKSPNLQILFDTGNPVLNYDRSSDDVLDKIQSSWEFYSNVKEFITYVHIKDAIYLAPGDNGFAKAEFTYAGDGQGNVKEIIADLLKNGYDGPFSIEPHMKLVLHENSSESEKEKEKTENYVEYGKRFMNLVNSLKQG